MSPSNACLRTLLASAGVAAAVLAVAGCEDFAKLGKSPCERAGTCDGGTAADAGDLGEPFLAQCQAHMAAYCRRQVECLLASQDGEGDCAVLNIRAQCLRLAESVRRGFRRFDADAGAACLAQVRESGVSCGDWPCALPLSPADAGAYGACSATSDCPSGHACFGAGNGCGKTCQPAGQLGQRCIEGRCTSGWCNPQTGQCSPPELAGGSCDRDRLFEQRCANTTYCDPATERCISLPLANMPCAPLTASPRCGPGTYCNVLSPATCRPHVARGGSCLFNDACGPNAYCDRDAGCATLHAVGTGCPGPGSCVDPYGCNEGQCNGPRGEGAFCINAECGPGLVCDSVLRQCLPLQRVDAGDACTGSARYCTLDEVCANVVIHKDGGVGGPGICRSPQVGDPCTTVNSCPARWFCLLAPDGGPGGCQPSLGNNPCYADDDCEAMRYCPRVPVGGTTRCLDRKPASVGCLFDYECRAPLRCQPTGESAEPRRCGARGGAAAACVSSEDCLFPFQCSTAGRCEPAGHTGQRCVGDVCIDGACNSALLCEPLRTTGQPCATHADCALGSCEHFTCQDVCR